MALEQRTWYTISEAAKQLGVSRQRMHQIIDETGAKTEAIHNRLKVISEQELQKIRRQRNPK